MGAADLIALETIYAKRRYVEPGPSFSDHVGNYLTGHRTKRQTKVAVAESEVDFGVPG